MFTPLRLRESWFNILGGFNAPANRPLFLTIEIPESTISKKCSNNEIGTTINFGNNCNNNPHHLLNNFRLKASLFQPKGYLVDILFYVCVASHSRPLAGVVLGDSQNSCSICSSLSHISLNLRNRAAFFSAS